MSMSMSIQSPVSPCCSALMNRSSLNDCIDAFITLICCVCCDCDFLIKIVKENCREFFEKALKIVFIRKYCIVEGS